jgi:hypothetical protein
VKVRLFACITTFTVLASFTTGCHDSDSEPSKAAVPERTSNPAPSGAQTATETSREAAVESCPGDWAKEAVFESYKAIGVAIEIDCAALQTSNYFYQFRLSDARDTFKVLERNLEMFKNWPQRPPKIVLGERAYHSSKNNLIQVPFAVSRPQDLEDYLQDTRLLMDLEINDFNGEIRFSYVDYSLAHRPDGEPQDVGTGALVGYGAAREQLVKDDIARIRKLKTWIQKAPFKNVRVTHANQMGSFMVSRWSDSYTLPTESTDSELALYFKYLTKLANVQKSFRDITVSVIVPAYPALEIERALQALEVLAGAKKAIEKLGVKSVHVSDTNISDIRRRFRVSKRNSGLTIDNLYKDGQKIQSAQQLTACLETADLDTTSAYFCDGRGDLRF